MKNKILILLLTIILITLLINLDKVSDYTSSIIDTQANIVIEKGNTYAHNDDFIYVQQSHDFVPYSKQDIINILFSIFNNGYTSFTFYCPSEYSTCIEDVKEITMNQTIITDIGNFVHPYNNFTGINVYTDSLGEVNVLVSKIYTEDMIYKINEKMDKIFYEVIKDNMKMEEKILALHDYFIDHTRYELENKTNSGNAYGAIIEGSAQCAGYADAMAIALRRLGVTTYKVASKKHVWNAIYLDNEWSQIDLTWDDPLVNNGTTLTDSIRHKFFMIDTKTLMSYNTTEHIFDKKVYLEL